MIWLYISNAALALLVVGLSLATFLARDKAREMIEWANVNRDENARLRDKIDQIERAAQNERRQRGRE